MASLFIAFPTQALAQSEEVATSRYEDSVSFEETKQETEVLPFETIRRENSSLAPGEEVVVQEGVNGERVETVKYIVKGDQRKVKERRLLSETPSQPKIIEFGPTDGREPTSPTTPSDTSNDDEDKPTSESTTEKPATTAETTTESIQDSETTEKTEKTENTEESESTEDSEDDAKDDASNPDSSQKPDKGNPSKPKYRRPRPTRDPFKLSFDRETQKSLTLDGAKKHYTFMIEQRLPTTRKEQINPQLAPGEFQTIQEGAEGVEYVKITVYIDRQGHSHLMEEVVGQKPPIESIVEVSGRMMNHAMLIQQTQAQIPEILQFFYQHSSIVDRMMTSNHFILNGPRIYPKPHFLPMTGDQQLILYHPYLGWTSVISGLLVVMRRI